MYLDIKHYCCLENTLIKMKRLIFIKVERYFLLLQQHVNIFTVAALGQSLVIQE